MDVKTMQLHYTTPFAFAERTATLVAAAFLARSLRYSGVIF